MTEVIVFLLISTLTVSASAGTVFEDLVNLATLGEYHQQIEQERLRVNKEISLENRQHQERLKSLEIDAAMDMLNLYESQYKLASLNLDELLKVIEIHKGVIAQIEKAMEHRLRSDSKVNDALEAAETVGDTYEMIVSIGDTPLNRSYLTEATQRWWKAIMAAETSARQRDLTVQQFLERQFNSLEENSLENLFYVCSGFSKVIAGLVKASEAESVKMAARYNTQLKVVQALGGNPENGLDLKL